MEQPGMVQLKLADGHLHAWVEQESSLHIKAITGAGDPVELSDGEVEKLIAFLQKYLERYA